MGWQSGISGLKMSCLHENQENKFSFKGFDLNSLLLRHTKNERIYDIWFNIQIKPYFDTKILNLFAHGMLGILYPSR